MTQRAKRGVIELISFPVQAVQVMRFICTCARGTEPAVVSEFASFGVDSEMISRGAVSFEAELEQAYRVLRRSRTAGRLLLELSRHEVTSDDEVYEAACTVAWEDHLDVGGSFVVDAVARGQGWNQRFVALRVKDAIADRFRERFGARPDVDREAPDLRVHVHLRDRQLDLAIDIGGGPLHRRGYRQMGSEAPLRENLAASLLWLAEWPRRAAEGQPLFDPMMGSGTLLVEGTCIALGLPPGNKVRRPPSGWLGHDRSCWERIGQELSELRDLSGRTGPEVFGSDVSPLAVRTALSAARTAGVDSFLKVNECDFAEATPPGNDPGLLVSNPPYGERLGEGTALPELYAKMGDVLRRQFLGWSAFLFSGNPSLQRNIGLKAARRHVLFNGPIECRLLEYPIREAPVRTESPGWRATSKEAEMFRNRLKKNRRRWQKWAKKNRVQCYRIYDADIPEYNVALDRYGDEFVLHEYRAPKRIAAGHAERRLRDAIAISLEEFEVPREALHLRVRKRQTGGKQYERREEQGERREVQENGHRFLVNLDEYLDAGIFLDQRPLRRLIQSEAKGTRFLNLFAYTGTATVYAAKGGAKETLTVDLSNTYNSWARSNFDLNGLARHEHRVQRADCLEWLQGDHGRFERILLAPPSYSRSRSMRGDFDLVRDYVPLLERAARHLSPDGVLYFVHHARGFKMDESAFPGLRCVETSSDTVAPDFARSPHRSWRITKKSR